MKEKVPEEEALEAQRQQLVDLEASILCAQQEVRGGVGGVGGWERTEEDGGGGKEAALNQLQL